MKSQERPADDQRISNRRMSNVYSNELNKVQAVWFSRSRQGVQLSVSRVVGILPEVRVWRELAAQITLSERAP
jgi:hypothetical protein